MYFLKQSFEKNFIKKKLCNSVCLNKPYQRCLLKQNFGHFFNEILTLEICLVRLNFGKLLIQQEFGNMFNKTHFGNLFIDSKLCKFVNKKNVLEICVLKQRFWNNLFIIKNKPLEICLVKQNVGGLFVKQWFANVLIETKLWKAVF